MSIRNLLGEEIQSEFDELRKIQLGSEEYKITVDGLTKLIDRANDLDKFDIERDDKIVTQETENSFKSQQIKNEKKDNLIRNIISGAGIIVPVGLTIWGTVKSLKFEETGTVTTIVGRGFINKLLPKK